MRTFYLPNGSLVQAFTDLDLVAALRAASIASMKSHSMEGFIENMAEWCKVERGLDVRTNSVMHFVHDLQERNVVVATEDPWRWIVASSIQLGLNQRLTFGTWNHRLLWSFEMPLVLSTQVGSEVRVYRYIDLHNLSSPGYQMQWVRAHVREIEQRAS